MLIAALLGACSPATGNYFAPTAADVCSPEIGCDKIEEAQISVILAQILRNPTTAAEFRGPQGPANRLDAERQVLTGLVRQTVAKRKAAKMGIVVKPSDVEARVRRIKAGFPNDPQGEQFSAALKAQGFSLDELKIYLGTQLMLQRVGVKLTKGHPPTEAELMAFYTQNKDALDSQIKVAHILVCSKTNESTKVCDQTAGDQALAAEIARRAKAGEDFGALAKQYSQDSTTASKGGELDYVGRGTLATEFEQAAFGLTQPGQISDPVKTVYGFHIIKLINKGRPFADARPELEKAVRAANEKKATDDWLLKGMRHVRVNVNQRIGRFDSVTQKVVPIKIRIAPRAPQPPAQAPQAPGAGPH